ncbi:MAG: hypothetical protein J5994_10735 [Ruminococcus sp.]|nr:hypothetical protein [Ruminococcus sp.]
MSDKNCNCNGKKKSAGNNQWTSSHQKSKSDKRERRDGPGGGVDLGG